MAENPQTGNGLQTEIMRLYRAGKEDSLTGDTVRCLCRATSTPWCIILHNFPLSHSGKALKINEATEKRLLSRL